MHDLILWAVAIVAWLTSIFPPLVCSRTRAAMVARCILACVIGGCLGFGLGRTLVECLFK